MQTLSVHDNRVVGYEVDGARRRIVLHTEGEGPEPKERTDVRFEGVVAYFFEGDNFETILFGIDEVSVVDLVERNRELFHNGYPYAWPGPWNTSVEASIAHMQSLQARAFEISSSYGFSGWVVATAYGLQPGGERSA